MYRSVTTLPPKPIIVRSQFSNTSTELTENSSVGVLSVEVLPDEEDGFACDLRRPLVWLATILPSLARF